jgi:UDP-GlcNAc:undecaprenyl-phosphate GlcNAc-1-phosphate transferase
VAGIALAFVVVLALFLAWASARLLVIAGNRRPSALDDTQGGLRKLHTNPTPRIGGAAIAVGLLVGALAAVAGGNSSHWLLLLACAIPGLIWGLIEDISKRGHVLVRLTLTASAAALGYVLLDARLTEVDVPGLNSLLAIDIFSFAFTVFAVTGVAHATNVIDGLNGLSGFTTMLAAIGIGIVAWLVGDSFIFSAAAILAASIAGFLIVNFPNGRIFLGDGGAYFIGLVMAELSVMLVQRNSEVSPWFPVVLLAYPIWETLFSMYRRKCRGQSVGHADALHLHTLVYRRIVRWRGYSGNSADAVMRNSLCSACLWVAPVMCFALALAFWNDSANLIMAGWAFNAMYLLVYIQVVRFRIPAWLVIRARPNVNERSSSSHEHGVIV